MRAAQPADLPAVSAILAASYRVLLAEAYDGALLRRLLPRVARANPRLLASGRYLIAEAGGAVAACGGWSWEWPGSDRADPRLAHVRQFATHPDWVRMGLGSHILDCCIASARSGGARRLRCHATINAEPFYAAHGFVTRGREVERMGPDLAMPVVVMERAP